MGSSLPAKLSFVASVAVLAFLLGFATRWHGWFPNDHLEAASAQATSLRKQWSDVPLDLEARVYDRSGARTLDSSAVQPGLTLITSAWPTPDGDGLVPGARLIDRAGRTVHAWQPDPAALFPSDDPRGGTPRTAFFHGAELRPDGDLLLALNYIGAVRLDACGAVEWTRGDGIHHSITRANDGSFWMGGVSAARRDSTARHPDGFPGLDGPVWMDRLLRVAPDGTIRADINVLDVLYDNGLQRYVRKAYGPSSYTAENGDPTHLNDIEALPAALADAYPGFEAGDLLVSLKHPNLIFVLDPASRTVKWHADSGPRDAHHLLQQHDPDFMGDGWIGVFDNREDFTDRGTMLGGSRVLAFQPHTDSVRVLFPTPASDTIYTRNRGKWELLANGNRLLVESNAGRVLEVTPDGRTVWEWIHAPYDEARVPPVTGAYRTALTRADVADWGCGPSGR
jgi:hypothetical protein